MFPDIEVYIKNIDLKRVKGWLDLHFDAVTATATSQNPVFKVTYQRQTAEIHYVEKAARGQFSSLWFKQNHTPWPTDLDCATSAAEFLQTEIRCSDGSWAEPSGAQDPVWYKLVGDEISKIRWED